MRKNLAQIILPTIVVLIASTLVPFGTFKIFQNAFLLEPKYFWRFTPAMPVHAIPMHWIVATVIANVIIAGVAVLGYKLFSRAIEGSWIRKGFVF